MDLIKIGKYIAGKRKGLGMTQRQLAEKLGMSDKSVSKWERGVCLPDVSVYTELCTILDISLNEFLAGEDIEKESIEKKSEENIIGVANDSKHKQKRLKAVIAVLVVISLLAISVIGMTIYGKNKPRNYIVSLADNSIEMQTVKLLSGPDAAHVYKFTTTDEFNSIKLHFKEYHDGKLLQDDPMEMGFGDLNSPEEGEFLLVPDFANFVIKVVISTKDTRLSTEFPILEDVPEREYYGRSATRIEGETKILYDSEQPLVGFIYDNDEMSVLDIYDLMDGKTESLQENDYVYLFSYEFCKK